MMAYFSSSLIHENVFNKISCATPNLRARINILVCTKCLRLKSCSNGNFARGAEVNNVFKLARFEGLPGTEATTSVIGHAV